MLKPSQPLYLASMKTRIISTVILWLVIILTLTFFGASGAIWLIVTMAALTQYELYNLLDKMDYRPLYGWGISLGIFSLLMTYYSPFKPALDAGSMTMGASTVLILLTILKRPDDSYIRQSLMPTLFGLVLVPFALQFYVRLIHFFKNTYMEEAGVMFCIWLIAVAKFADVGGFLLGKRFGRHKLAPKISPGKTWEGVAGGLLASLAIGIALVVIFKGHFPGSFSIWKAALIAIPVAAVGIASDLLESVIKRQANVKDSGDIIPGIGGAFDLTDSLLLSAPLGYILITLTLY